MRKIVLIDDDKDICELMKKTLTKTGLYEVFVANDGRAGEALCLEVLPELVFLDFVMPNEKGDQVIRFLKKHKETEKIPIVLMSGLGEMVYFEKKDQWKWLPNTAAVQNRGDLPDALMWKDLSDDAAIQMGVKIYLTKPFNRQTLLDAAAHLLKDIPKEDKSV